LRSTAFRDAGRTALVITVEDETGYLNVTVWPSHSALACSRFMASGGRREK
jgi:hypothetical protein